MANHLHYETGSGQQTKVLLLWTKCRQPISQLSRNVLREVCSYLHPRHLILGLSKQKAAVFDIEKQSFQQASLSMDIPDTCVFSELSTTSVLLLGFNNKSVYSLSFPNLRFTPLPEMRGSRSWPGSIRYGAFVYVFGGFSESVSLASSERYSVFEGEWQTLPNMRREKFCFSPVIHSCRIYLPIFADVNTVECFDPESLTFTVQCELPEVVYVSVAAVVGNEIVLLTWEKAYRVSLGSEVAAREEHRLDGFSGLMETKGTPLVVGREVWFMLVNQFVVVKYLTDEQKIQTFTRESGEERENSH